MYLLGGDLNSTLSPNGRYVGFFGVTEASEIGKLPLGVRYLFDLESSKLLALSKLQIYLGGRNSAAWSHDGEKLAYGSPDAVSIFDATRHASRSLTAKTDGGDPAQAASFNFAWSKDDRQISYDFQTDARSGESLQLEPTHLDDPNGVHRRTVGFLAKSQEAGTNPGK